MRCRSWPATLTVRSSNSRSDIELVEIVVMFFHNTTIFGGSARDDAADRDPKLRPRHSDGDRWRCTTTRAPARVQTAGCISSPRVPKNLSSTFRGRVIFRVHNSVWTEFSRLLRLPRLAGEPGDDHVGARIKRLGAAVEVVVKAQRQRVALDGEQHPSTLFT